jgi:hypothetical protein
MKEKPHCRRKTDCIKGWTTKYIVIRFSLKAKSNVIANNVHPDSSTFLQRVILPCFKLTSKFCIACSEDGGGERRVQGFGGEP